MKPVSDAEVSDGIDGLAALRRRVFEEYVAELALERPLAILLELVLEGARGPILCHGMRTDDAGLQRLERSFSRRTGKSVYVAAVDVLGRASRRRRSV